MTGKIDLSAAPSSMETRATEWSRRATRRPPPDDPPPAPAGASPSPEEPVEVPPPPKLAPIARPHHVPPSAPLLEGDFERPTAAPPVFPFRDHRTLAEVDAANPPARQWCAGCQQKVTFETASECRNVLCPKGGR